uniref:B30.2/SPRY domain-containing protein n=1 Tax=Tetradesmus obliquus TaxID=3088 RepID=A0A383VPB8_TETOB|eukprot:jgi/Sobl393_1/2675/SZX66730.1
MLGQQASVQKPHAAAVAPDAFNTAQHGPGLEIGKDKLSIRYVGDGRHDNDVGSIQGNRPVPTQQLLYYFELTVVDQGELGRIAIGFTEKSFKLTRQPGWEASSYGYHGDDGRKFYHSEKGEEYGPKWSAGDTVGACLHFERQEIFFTKNGTRLKTAFRNVRPQQLYPTIGLHSKNEHVVVNFGGSPFKFDLEGLLAEEREQQAAAVQRMSVAASDAHQIVRSYLLFHGYGATLAAFDAAAGAEGIAQPMCEGDDAEPMSATLATRQAVRGAIMAGQLVPAMELLRQQCPGLLGGSAVADEVQFHMSCQQFIELIREGRIMEAMQFAQSVLAGLKPGAAHKDSQLKEVVALIAYEHPQQSPLAHLLHLSQREAVADAVNAAILQVAGQSAAAAAGDEAGAATKDSGSTEAGSSPPQSSLEVLLRQLVATRMALREEHGGGEPFDLCEALQRSRS